MSLYTDRVDSRARLVKSEGDPQKYGFQLIRAWPKIHSGSTDTLAVALAAVKFYTNPKAENKAYTGTFLQSRSQTESDPEAAYENRQELVKVRTNLTDSNAQLEEIEGRPWGYGYKLRRSWKYIDPRSGDTLFLARQSTKFVTNPKADNQAFTGSFLQSPAALRKEKDETVTLGQVLTRVRTNLVDSNACLIGVEGDPAHAGYKLIEAWDYVDPRSVDTLLAVWNAKVTVQNPTLDGQAYNDTFVASRFNPVKRDDETVTMQRTLTRVKDTYAAADWDLIQMKGDPKVVGVEIIRGCHYINPEAVKRLMDRLNTVTERTNPKINGDTVTGTFAVSQHRAVEQEDRSCLLEETLKKVRTVGSDTDLLHPIIEREKEGIHPFGNGTGTGWGIIFKYLNLAASSDTKCMAIADTTLVAKKAKVYAKPQGDSYALVDRKTTIEDNRTCTFYILFRRKNRTELVTASTPDFREYGNKGRRNEIRKKYWYGRDRANHATNLNTLETATNDTGFYTIGPVEFADDDNGAKSYIWSQAKSWTDTRTDSQYINPHGITHVANAIKRTEAHGYTVAALPADPTLTGGYNFVQKQVVRNPQTGMLDKEFVQRKATASNTVTGGAPLTQDTVAFSPAKGSTDVDSVTRQKRILIDDIPTAQGPAVVAARAVSDTWHVVSDVRYEDKGNGAGRVEVVKQKVNRHGVWYYSDDNVDRIKQVGIASKTRVWPRIWDTKADTICGYGGVARKSWAYLGDSYVYSKNRRIRHWDGTSTVEQIGNKYVTAGTSTDADWSNYIDGDTYVTPQFRRTHVGGVWQDSVRWFTHRFYYIQTTSRAKAWDFVSSNEKRTGMSIPGGGNKHPVKFNVTPLSKGRYRAWCICDSITQWTSSTGENFTDVGGKT